MASGGGRRRKPRRGTRAKAKKTKYLSLSRLIKAEVGTPPPSEEAEVKREDGGEGGGQNLLEPFALHHEASILFEASPAPSLSDILGASAASDESPSPSASPDGGSGGAGFPGAEEDLARRALRGRERWVYCRTSSSPTATTTTTTTSSASPCSSAASTGASARSLRLKLDYEEILAAWADRGSLYIGGAADGYASPKPELDDVLVEVEPSQPAAAAAAAAATACACSAPETAGTGRAERVRRYREKRRSRLFEKRIRYEVRRVNAVKRPRFKGRFIKESEESELQPT